MKGVQYKHNYNEGKIVNRSIKVAALLVALGAAGVSLASSPARPVLKPTPAPVVTPSPSPTATPTPAPSATTLPTTTHPGAKVVPTPVPTVKPTPKPLSLRPAAPLVMRVAWNGVEAPWLDFYKGSLADPSGFKGFPLDADGKVSDQTARDICIYAAHIEELSAATACGPYYQAIIREATYSAI